MKKNISILISCILVVFLVACNITKKEKVSPYSDDIQMKLNKMSLEEKIDQMIMLSIDEVVKDGGRVKFTEMNEATKSFLSKHQLAGVILFKFNMIDKLQTEKLTKDIQNLSKVNKFFIATDQEGGRISKIPTENKTMTAREIGNTKDPNNAYKAARIIGGDLKSLGLNLDFAPVMDVDTNPNNPIIGDRAFSNDPKIVGEFGVKFMEGLHSHGILATAKHFPGHGDTTGDSHKELVKVNQPLQRIENVELYPFKKAIENNVDMIMVGHIIVPALDDDKTPASLSKKMMTSLLKEKMGFKGVVITDAFDMKAITQNYEIKSAVVQAINAGADIILMPVAVVPGENEKDYEELVRFIKEKVQAGEISESRINDAVTRILTAKKSL
ncbi:beta-N-acetylhexosaminidase [Clostridium sp. 'White wine YQ']|uniref:beta-N-acetylhexosaminidase n=1 Tax=Clostridium sp. 'White wine YQ' TaxID=3027474 RepID=UPI002366F792|nr:beta-N-acetylhexosaminidase [Clostridium sp. 'White wine YQ']MDD7793193.1 beta-N-acetylhexosaminidase [Clostridium sp. 'White wine YQ']